MNENVELVAAYWTLAVGAEPHGGHEYSTVSFQKRVEAAARAGFRGIGIWHADLAHTLQNATLKDMQRILQDNGIKHVELEFLTDWWFADGERKQQADARKQKLFEAADVLGARVLKVGDFLRTICPMPQLIDAFAALCREGAEHGVLVAYEMMPFSQIDSLEAALALAQGAGAKNGGIYFDLWHIVKLGIPYEAVARFPAQYRAGIELNDGYVQSLPDLVEETTQHRKLCGAGEFDIQGFIRCMKNAGHTGPWGVEVLSRELRNLPIEELAPRAFNTSMEQFVG